VLLVVDDVWEDAQLRPFRFGGRTCTRLVTTRVPEIDVTARIHRLRTVTELISEYRRAA
jgi:hypothetical protein